MFPQITKNSRKEQLSEGIRATKSQQIMVRDNIWKKGIELGGFPVFTAFD